MMENLLQEVLFFTALFKKVGHHLPAQTCSLFSHSLLAKLVTSLHCGVGEDSWESLGLHGDPTSPFWRRSALGVLWRTEAKAELPILWPHHAKSWLIGKDSDAGRDLGAGGEGDCRGWDGWMASPTQRTWVWVNSGSWWWTGRPGVL